MLLKGEKLVHQETMRDLSSTGRILHSMQSSCIFTNAPFLSNEILNKLPRTAGASFNSRRLDHERLCLNGTRENVLHRIRLWTRDPESACIFWLSGMAGTGKSTIARTAARQFSEDNQLGASFFFSRGAGELAKTAKLFTTLAYQLAGLNSKVHEAVCAAISKYEDIAEHSLRDQWKHLILQPLSCLGDATTQRQSVVIIIDALDECEDEDDVKLIIWLFSQAKDLKSVHPRIFITSRPETPIRCGFDDIPEADHHDFILHDISKSVVSADLTLFFRHEFARIKKDRRVLEEWPGESTISKLVQSADGLFIYAATICRFFGTEGSNPRQLLSTVLNEKLNDESLTKHLDSMYAQILLYAYSTSDNLQAIFTNVVGTIVTLADTRTTDALAKFLGIEKWNIEDALRSLSSLLHCAAEDGKIRVLHASFRDFLLDPKRCLYS
jgi:hypothetical protein